MTSIKLSIADEIAWLTFEQPDSRANVLSTALWTEFGTALDQLNGPGIRGLILQSAKPGIFIAGADLKELADASPDQPAPTRALIELGLGVLKKLENLPCPTVAVIDGAALGGGLEVALGCDFRICGTHPKVQLGLPEIKLGLLPGWGGSQRLPRLIGVEEAIDRLLSGESFCANDPPPEDLVDQTVDSADLKSAAIEWLMDGDMNAVRDAKRSPVPADWLPSDEFLADTQVLLAEMPEAHRPAAIEILSVVLTGCLAELDAGLRLETEAFLRLAGTSNSRQLIADFFNKRKK